MSGPQIYGKPMPAPLPPPVGLTEQLAEAKARVVHLEKAVAGATTCAELGCDMKHIGGRNAGCNAPACSCSIPVHQCTRCGDCDYGQNEEANQTKLDCAIERGA